MASPASAVGLARVRYARLGRDGSAFPGKLSANRPGQCWAASSKLQVWPGLNGWHGGGKELVVHGGAQCVTIEQGTHG